MPESSHFTVITDTVTIVPPPPQGLSDVHIRDISFPGLNPRRRAILAFRLKVAGEARLTMRFNSNPHCIDYNFDPAEPPSTRPRTWHEVIPGTDLQEERNELTISVSGDGRAEISDIVVFYRGAASGTTFDPRDEEVLPVVSR